MTLAYTAFALNPEGKAFYAPALITATGNDTTATVNSQVFTNDGSLRSLSYVLAATDKTGTSPTVTVALQGSNDGTNYVAVKDSGGNAITTGAVSISSAGGGTTITSAVDTNGEGIELFPFRYLRLQATVGGSSTPGWTGTVGVFGIRW